MLARGKIAATAALVAGGTLATHVARLWPSVSWRLLSSLPSPPCGGSSAGLAMSVVEAVHDLNIPRITVGSFSILRCIFLRQPRAMDLLSLRRTVNLIPISEYDAEQLRLALVQAATCARR